MRTVSATVQCPEGKDYFLSVVACHVAVLPVVLSEAIECTAIFAMPCCRAASKGSTAFDSLESFACDSTFLSLPACRSKSACIAFSG